ncbi:phage portal protein [Streptomyces sp. NPDC020800]|uniref:phage portal protein n=1 Tax=Streptomyces sp. NPDC020800 TaxID=3365092 RepID=UPI0037A4289C
MAWWRRTRLGPVRRRRQDDDGPVLVGDTWMDGRGHTRITWLQAAGATWRRRLGTIGRGARRTGGWLAGVEIRGVERRAITSVPWDQGGPVGTSTMNTERALRLAPVYAAGRILCSNLSAAPLRQYRQSGDAMQQLALASLFVKPSTQGTLHDWIWRCVASMAYRGNAVGYITTTDFYEYPTGIEWLNPDWVSVQDQLPSGPGSFTDPIWRVLGEVVPAENLVHIPWFTLPGRVWGLSPIGAFASTVRTGLAAQDYTEQWFESGGVPPGTFKNVNAKVDQKEASVIKARLVEAIRSRQPVVYGKDWDYNAITIPAHEAKFVETMRLTATQIAAIFGVPPEMIGGETGGSMSYSSPEQREIELVQLSLLPWMTKLESHFSNLLPRGQIVRFDADSLIRVDPLTRWGMWERARLIGAMNIDEIRARENLSPLPDGAGQDYTALPLLTQTQVSLPTVRDGHPDRLRLVPPKSAEHG